MSVAQNNTTHDETKDVAVYNKRNNSDLFIAVPINIWHSGGIYERRAPSKVPATPKNHLFYSA